MSYRYRQIYLFFYLHPNSLLLQCRPQITITITLASSQRLPILLDTWNQTHNYEGRAATSFGGAFYAYIHNIQKDDEWRIVIIFASRSIADEWWREISTAKINLLQNNIQRITPQFYTHNVNQWNFFHFFTENKIKDISEKFRGKMFLSLQNNRGDKGFTIIPAQSVVDHASGDWFSIRSKANANQYWYYDDAKKFIVVSESQRTYFKISTPDMPDGAIMVGRDRITLSTQHHGFVIPLNPDGVSGVPLLGVTDKVSEASGKFTFGDLDKGRFVPGFKKDLPSALSYMPNGGVGGWELAL